MHKVKIAPSTKTGAHHWLMQRASAIALIPLVLWLVVSFIQFAQSSEDLLSIFFANPVNAVAAILLLCTALYHGSLGMRVIIEDYVSHKIAMHALIMLINFISIATAVAVVISIIKLHLIG